MVEQDSEHKPRIALPLTLLGALITVILVGYIWWIFDMLTAY